MPRFGALARYARTFTGFERDARIFLLTTLVSGAAISLFWIDFNLYLESLGQGSIVGLIAGAVSVAGTVIALPASALSDRVGRRWVMIAAGVLVAIAFSGFVFADTVPLLFVLAALYGAGSQAFNVVTVPFLAEHSSGEHRSELFAIQFAIGNITNIGAAVIGGLLAGAIATALGLDASGPGAYRVVIAIMALLSIAALGTLLLIGRDRPVTAARERRAVPAPRRARFGMHVENRRRMVRLLLPGFLTSLGAGQIIPFLNVFVEGRFHLSLAALNAVFAVTSLGTLIAVLLQPALARRFGKVASVVIVQAASIPFFVVLGWSPVFWTVIAAMAVRNSLMNAGNPIANAFAMEHLLPAERATYSALATLLWSLGWSIAGPFYYVVQTSLGFDSGFAVNFMTVILLYSVGTFLYWTWFRDAESRAESGGAPMTAAAPEPLS